MELNKLCANHEKLSPGPEQNYNFATLTETKTLGVSWKPNLDCFLIKVKVCLDSSYTKRDVLSTIAKIFDPVGLMAPVISKAKIFLQRLWRSKLEWNDLLPAEEYREWQQFLVSLENINNIEIPRRILVAFPEVTEIHGFADASERCYGAAVYCKSKNLKSETLVRLITSKSRVAPIKSLTIPRLELCAAVLLAKLVKRVVAALQLETAEVYLWSDSMIDLAWLRKKPMDLKTFVQNRVAKIQELYPNQLWRHVPSDQNPADLVSRGVDPEKLLQQNLWFNGPKFLSGDDYPNRTINCREKLDEYNSELKNCVNEQIENFQSVLNIHVNDFLNDLLNLSNNYITILRVLSFIFRFVENLKGINKVAGPLTTKEFEKAETYMVKKVQEQEFSSDINHLKSKGSVLPNTKPIVSTQIMGNLPKERLITDYPFNCSGVDFCGSFFIKNKGQLFTVDPLKATVTPLVYVINAYGHGFADDIHFSLLHRSIDCASKETRWRIIHKPPQRKTFRELKPEERQIRPRDRSSPSNSPLEKWLRTAVEKCAGAPSVAGAANPTIPRLPHRSPDLR
ncbi:uncharacterized protein TNCV_2606931 [Trichonephila clavipes]|uniref:Uncharacterized protein n=1 Tax=Trichonephila clavipes TaxID=2585209 RepID=A0A8X6S3V1_TRICX|nr:uncharacterized protein TNCV_2606931 [Trichonephila clavipes]